MVLKDYVFQKRQFLTLYDMILASSSSGGWMGMSMMLSIIEQIIKEIDMMFISYSVIYSQSYISWMVMEFVGLSEDLFLMCTSETIVNDINRTKLRSMIKNQDMKFSFFQNFRQHLHLSVFREWWECLTCSFWQISLITAL